MTDLISLKPFNMRPMHLANLSPPTSNDHRHRPLGYRSQSMAAHMIRYRHEYLVTSPQQSLDLLRQVLQAQINRDIDELLNRYNQTFFQPASRNIQSNLQACKDGCDKTFEIEIKEIFCEILDQAKAMYRTETKTLEDEEESSSLVADNSTTTTNSPVEHSPLVFKARGRLAKCKTTKTKTSKLFKKKLSKTKVELEAVNNNNNEKEKIDLNLVEAKWNPSRLSTKTLFVLGSKANKALGFGMARGRLYTKHSNLFRYIGDQEDKEWLHRNQLMPPTGGKAYLLVRDDILELIQSAEYRHVANTNMEDMGEGFTVPQTMINKMVATMETNGHLKHAKMTISTNHDDEPSFHSNQMMEDDLALLDGGEDLSDSFNDATFDRFSYAEPQEEDEEL